MRERDESMASDSILTSIPFWIVIGVIFVLAVAWADLLWNARESNQGVRQLLFCTGRMWNHVLLPGTCCCRRETVEDTKPTKPACEKSRRRRAGDCIA